MKTVLCATYEGIEAKVVDVEVTLTKGLPSFSIVGIASASINEAKERVKSALLSNNFSFPPKRITINLSPSDLKKEGSHFDLSIALLIALENSDLELNEWFVFGELGLDGKIKENIYIYPLILSLAKQQKIKKVLVPSSATNKLSKIPNIEFYGVENLQEAIDFFQADQTQRPRAVEKESFEYPFYELEGVKYYYRKEYEEDFIDVRGQEIAKRAALIAAAGFHNILFEGSPGCGKSMIAKRMQYILPALSHQELLELAKLDALEMKEPDFLPCRNFRAPHHTATAASIFGGGVIYNY